jgi:hypothetical protein
VGDRTVRRTEFGRRRQAGRRVQVYVELRDLWVGAYIAPTAVYVCAFGVVLRVTR